MEKRSRPIDFSQRPGLRDSLVGQGGDLEEMLARDRFGPKTIASMSEYQCAVAVIKLAGIKRVLQRAGDTDGLAIIARRYNRIARSYTD